MAGIGSLPLFHRIRGQKVLVLGDGEAAAPKRRLVERAGGIIEDDMQRAVDEGVRIAFVAYDDARACENAAINLRCAGMLVNVVDMPALCDFTTPSILDRDPVLIAVGTGGASAGLAKHVRLRMERILPEKLGDLAKALFGARDRLRERFRRVRSDDVRWMKHYAKAARSMRWTVGLPIVSKIGWRERRRQPTGPRSVTR